MIQIPSIKCCSVMLMRCANMFYLSGPFALSGPPVMRKRPILQFSKMLSALVFFSLASIAEAVTWTPVPGWPSKLTTTLCQDASYYQTVGQRLLPVTPTLTTEVKAKCRALCTADKKCQAIVSETRYLANAARANAICKDYEKK